MKTFSSFFLLLALLTQSVFAASTDEVRFEQLFANAARAYDENHLPEAISGWESLLNENQQLPEVLFNLGNAYYRNGNLGKAIWTYRQAERLAPRDPDIRANLGFAAQATGISLPARNTLATWLLDVSQKEWQVWGSACFWLLSLSLAAWILKPRFRFISRPAAIVLTALLLLALAGLWTHRDWRQRPECVVMHADQKILSGPLETATPLLAIPEGAIVRMLEPHGNWVEVQTDAVRGWLPAAAVAAVH